MITVLSDKDLTARKEHHCYFCGGIIKKGELYHNQVNIYDGDFGEIKSCKYCSYVSYELGMYDDLDEDGLSDDTFREYINQYVYDNHYDDSIDGIAKDWQLPLHEQVKKIYEELKSKEEVK